MKKIIAFVALIFLFVSANAQDRFLAGFSTEKTVRVFNSGNEKDVKNEKCYSFKVYAGNDIPKGDIEPHYLGSEIAGKWSLVNELYLKKSEVNMGFSSTYTETVKPAILNAVYKMNAFYKKALNRKTIKVDEAQKQFSWILDCAIAIFYCSDSAEFELALAKTKDPNQIAKLFNSVKIEKN